MAAPETRPWNSTTRVELLGFRFFYAEEGSSRFEYFVLGFWKVIVPMWMILMVTAVPPLLWLAAPRLRRRRRARKGLCPSCCYDLRGSTGACPECGAGRV